MHFKDTDNARKAAEKRWSCDKTQRPYGRRTIEVVCDECGVVFKRFPRNVKSVGNHYCNNCKNTARGTFTKENTRGQNNPTAKLTEENVLEIKRAIKKGINRFYIAQKYDVTPAAIYDIASGRRWKHVVLS